MKRKNQPPIQNQNTGYPQQNGYPPEGYPVYSQQATSADVQGYAQSQGYPQPAGFAYSQPRSYQTPQVTGNQPAVGSGTYTGSGSYTGQGAYMPAGYSQQGYPHPQQTGFTGGSVPPQNGYPQQGANTMPGYGYPGYQAPSGSYIPQTPYSQGYTAPSYSQQPGYSQNYSPYNQMGRNTQPVYPPVQEAEGQVPLNTGGYIPQPVPVRKRPFVLSDAYLLMISAALLALFALGMFVSGLGVLKWVFLSLAVCAVALLWFKPMTDANKRLCFTIVFGLLVVVTVIGFVIGGTNSAGTGTRQTGADPVNTDVTDQRNPYTTEAVEQNTVPTPVVTYTPEPDLDSAVTSRLETFFNYWMVNNQDGMLSLCSPSWSSKQENAKTALFALIMNRTPLDYEEENISGTPNDDNRTVTITSRMDRNNGKDPVRYRLNVMMVKESDGLWYVDPQSLQSNDKADTPDPSITDTPAPTETPATYPETVLYYNPSGGEYYHRDQNCKRINERYLPLKGHFTYAEIDKYPDLKPCSICGAPSRPK